MTPTANRRHYTRNLEHDKLAVDEASNHGVIRYSKWSGKIIQTTINMHQDPPISDTIILVEQLVVNVAQYSINLTEKNVFFSLTIRFERVSITAEKRKNVVLQLIDLFRFLRFVKQAVCGQHKHTGQTT